MKPGSLTVMTDTQEVLVLKIHGGSSRGGAGRKGAVVYVPASASAETVAAQLHTAANRIERRARALRGAA